MVGAWFRAVARLALAAILAASEGAHAEEEHGGTDLSFKLGAITGTLTDVASNGLTTSFSFGGMPVAISFNQVHSPKLLTDPFFEVVVDFTNEQASRESLGYGITYYVFGSPGPVLLAEHGSYAVTAQGSSWGLGLRAQAAIEHYSIVTQQSTATGVVDTSLDATLVGLEVGADLGYNPLPGTSIGAELLVTALSLSASSPRAQAQTTEVLLYWRRHF